MSHTPVFTESLTIEFLQYLTNGSLKQSLLRGIRLWVWLHSLYGESALNLKDPFTFTDWKKSFFSPTHPQGEKPQLGHDVQCNCMKKTADWIEDILGNLAPSSWQEKLLTHLNISHLETLLSSPLFGVTRRALWGDLDQLSQQGWLNRQGQKYYRVDQFPPFPKIPETLPLSASISLNFLPPDLAIIAENFIEDIQGVQRFYIQLDYIAQETLDLIDDWQILLKEVWQKIPISPLSLSYNNFRLHQKFRCVVYPVCLYYIQRTLYLCAWGEIPESPSQISPNWHNFRLDRVTDIKVLTWTDISVPAFLLKSYQTQNLPHPDHIAQEMSKAWGFEFYRPKTILLLRFEKHFYQDYIKGTFRHQTWKKCSVQDAQEFIVKSTPGEPQKELLKILNSRSPQDAYCYTFYRQNDINIRLRLRSWRPNAEILLPWDLRENIAQEVRLESHFYL